MNYLEKLREDYIYAKEGMESINELKKFDSNGKSTIENQKLIFSEKENDYLEYLNLVKKYSTFEIKDIITIIVNVTNNNLSNIYQNFTLSEITTSKQESLSTEFITLYNYELLNNKDIVLEHSFINSCFDCIKTFVDSLIEYRISNRLESISSVQIEEYMASYNKENYQRKI